MANYITKSFDTSVSQPSDTESLAKRFETVLNNVKSMIKNNGPIYHTWIAFQVGTDSEAVVFNTDTTDPDQNCIAQLEINKTGAGTANDFTLKVVYDVFNYGQETNSTIEQLDEYLANALSKKMESVDALRGYIQYGYVNTGTDADLVSPYYSFILTNAESNVSVSSGITTYTFKGVTDISSDCDFQANIGQYDTNWKLLDVVEWTIFYHYGDNDNKPSHTTGEASENEYKYRIDIPDDLYSENENLTVGYVNNDQPLEATTMNPIQYVSELLEQFPLTYSEIESGEWDNYDELTVSSRPRYEWYITDSDGVKTWHLVHYNPSDSDSATDTNYTLTDSITWGKQEDNIVVNWNPSVDNMTYLIQRASYIRAQQQLEEGGIDLDSIENDDYKSAIADAVENNVTRIESSIVKEYYDAELTLIGIPADPPVCLRMIILPRIGESVSRTKGTYIVESATDTISSKGVYTTLLKLTRIDDEEGSYGTLKTTISEQESALSEVSSSSSDSSTSTSSGGGGSAMGGR